MAQVKAINAKNTLFWLILLVEFGHVPLLEVTARDKSEKEIFF